jgi:hypothetical protein
MELYKNCWLSLLAVWIFRWERGCMSRDFRQRYSDNSMLFLIGVFCRLQYDFGHLPSSVTWNLLVQTNSRIE